MGYVIYIFLALAALLGAVKGFISKPKDRKELWAWRIECVIALILFAAAILQWPVDINKQFQKVFDSIRASEDRIVDTLISSQEQVVDTIGKQLAGMQCTLDFLKELLQDQAAAPKEGKHLYADSAREQAECIAATGLLETAMDSGLVAIGLGNYREAEINLNLAVQAAQDDSSRFNAFFYRGVAYSLWGDSLSAIGEDDSASRRYEQAITSYDSVLAYKPDKHDAWYNRGIALGNLERYDEEVASYDSALAYKHDYHEAWYNRGIALRHLERYDEAVASYDSALVYKHDKHNAWYNRGNALRHLERYDEAVASYDSALAYKPDDHEAWNNRGIVLSNLRRYEEATASFDSALAYKPDDHEAWYNRGIALSNLRRYEEAIASFDSALAYKHDKSEAWTARGGVLALMKHYEEALTSCDSALKYEPGLKKAIEIREIILEEMNR